MKTRTKNRLYHGLAAAMLLCSLSACSSSEDTPEAAAVPSAQSVAALIADADNLSSLASALEKTGLASVFDGKASYTLLAPDDAAFASLGENGKDMIEGSDNAAIAALLKEHMLPGYVTLDDLAAAIDTSDDGSVTMTNLAGEALTFTREGEAIMVASPDGKQVALNKDALAGGQSIAIPVDGLLKQT